MTTRRFKWAGFDVYVRAAGETVPGFDPDGQHRHRYRVSVCRDGERYKTYAWASIRDYEAGSREPETYRAMGAMVLDELASAYCDPDEFMELVLGPEGDRGTAAEVVARVRQADGIIAQAKRFGPALLEASEELREKELI